MEVRTLVLGNVATLGLLGVVASTVWLFLPYVPTLLWAQVCALALRGLRDSLKVKRKESEAKAARRLLGYTVLAVTTFLVFAAVGLAFDLKSIGEGVAKAGRAAEPARGWLAQQTQSVIAEVKPKVMEAAAPYVDFGATTTQLKVDAILEKVGNEDLEPAARSALNAANSLLDGDNDWWDGFKDEAMKSVATLKAKFGDDSDVQAGVKEAAAGTLKALATGVSLLSNVVAHLASLIASSISTVVNSILFFLAVFAQLARPDEDLDEFLSLAGKTRLQTLAKVAESLIVAPVLRAFFFALATLTLVLLANAGCPTTASLFAFASGLFSPFVPSFVASVPWALALALRGLYLRAVVFLVAHFVVTSRIASSFTASLAHLLDLPLSFVNLSYVLGAQRLGLPQGLVLGPLLLAVSVLLFDVVTTEKITKTAATTQEEEKQQQHQRAPAAATLVDLEIIRDEENSTKLKTPKTPPPPPPGTDDVPAKATPPEDDKTQSDGEPVKDEKRAAEVVTDKAAKPAVVETTPDAPRSVASAAPVATKKSNDTPTSAKPPPPQSAKHPASAPAAKATPPPLPPKRQSSKTGFNLFKKNKDSSK